METSTTLPRFDVQNATRATMVASGQSVGVFNAEQYGLYTGLQCEELAEKLAAIASECISRTSAGLIGDVATALDKLASDFKRGLHTGDVMRAMYHNGEKLLDGDADMAVVAVGALESGTHDAAGVIHEVCRANSDKFPGGVGQRDENGKWKKPEGWRGPDLTPFLPDLDSDI
jgi:predicted HAD superfamily Cof-like phosphohydrolase